jgi:2-polyprenyl-3-methyl-5-hydroxy-6-metoxy-1,4-benzoquinol methylase
MAHTTLAAIAEHAAAPSPESKTEPPAPSLVNQRERALTQAHRRWHELTQELQSLAHGLVSQFPGDRTARYFLAESLQAAGRMDLALDEFEKLLEDASPNERYRIRQAIEQCRADQIYFPKSFRNRLSTGEYAAGHNAQVWRDYALRDIQRGREIVRRLQSWKPLQGKRALDVGCGYGGMLIAMAEQGAEVTGVEIDPERARMGRLRLDELGLHASLHESDICSPGMAARLGMFDVISCQDVLEHVMDPTEMIRTVSSLLRPGGVIYIQVPNKWGVQQLMADHHYALTGITALSRNQAIEYWKLATGEEARHYGVGYPRGERYYLNTFARCGVQLQHLQNCGSLYHLAWFARDVKELCSRLEREIYPGLRPELEARIRHRIVKVLNLYSHGSQVILQLQANPTQQGEACDRFVRRLCLPLWQFIGTKGPSA